MNMIRLSKLTALAACLAFACSLTAAGDDKEGEGKGKGKIIQKTKGGGVKSQPKGAKVAADRDDDEGDGKSKGSGEKTAPMKEKGKAVGGDDKEGEGKSKGKTTEKSKGSSEKTVPMKEKGKAVGGDDKEGEGKGKGKTTEKSKSSSEKSAPIIEKGKAVGGDDKEGEGKGKGKKGTSFTAQVTAVDVTKSTITLAVRDGTAENSPLVDKTFAVAKDAKISIAGKAAKLADVKTNSRAAVSLTDDRKTVTGITLGKGKGGDEGGEKSQPKKEKGKG